MLFFSYRDKSKLASMISRSSKDRAKEGRHHNNIGNTHAARTTPPFINAPIYCLFFLFLLSIFISISPIDTYCIGISCKSTPSLNTTLPLPLSSSSPLSLPLSLYLSLFARHGAEGIPRPAQVRPLLPQRRQGAWVGR